MDDQEKIWEVISRKIANEATPEDDVLFNEWLKKDGNRQVFDSLSNIKIPNFEKDSKTASKEVFEDIQNRIAARSKRIRLYYFTGTAAAAVLLLFVINTFFIKTRSSPINTQAMIEITAPIGSKESIILDDGTRVWLNAGTSLSYSKDYAENNRDVFLKGEAYFEVTKNMEKPFVVHANGVNIIALGTIFNVKAYIEEGQVEAILTEGSIRVEYADEQYGYESIVLKPNQIAVCKIGQNIETSDIRNNDLHETPQVKGEMNAKNNKFLTAEDIEDVRIYTSWKDAKWVFKHEKLVDLSRKLERRYGVNILFDGEEIKNCVVSGTFLDEDLAQALETLKLIAPIQYRIDQKTVFLREDKDEMKKYKSVTN